MTFSGAMKVGSEWLLPVIGVVRGQVSMLKLRKKWKKPIQISGLIIIAIGIIMGFGNLRGWFKKGDRVEFLRWVMEEPAGMPFDAPAAREFMRKFPPPKDARVNEITHITKQTINSAGGPPMSASINYMHRDGTRTTYMATLEQVRDWARESSYPWAAWEVTVVGFIPTLLATLIGWKES